MSNLKRDHIEESRYDLIPLDCLRELALIYAEGARKYGIGEWKSGLEPSDTLNHAFEHLRQYQNGNRDENHLAKIAWAMFTLMWYNLHPSDQKGQE